MSSNIINKNYELWINDKSPIDLDDVIGNSFFIKTIKNCISKEKMPNLLLHGSEGTGKKMIAKLIAKKYGGDYKIISATINKSKDIVVINLKNKESFDCINITAFAQAKNKAIYGDKMKIIIITNFDEMTLEAQNALRSIIETYSYNTRFIITTTKIDDIISPLRSRFNTFLIKKLSNKKLNSIISRIITDIIPQELIDLIVLLSDGDIRQIFNYLQLMSNAGSLSKDSIIDIFNSIFKLPNIIIIKQLINEIYIIKNAPESIKIMNSLLKNYDAQITLNLFIKIMLLSPCVKSKDIFYTVKLVLKRLTPRVHFITLINKLIINNIIIH